MISVPQRLTLNSIDGIIARVRANPEAVLSFPSEIELRSILSSAAYIQFLLTWASISQKREIQFTVSKQDHIAFLSRAPETLIPILLSRKVSVRTPNSPVPVEFDVTNQRQEGLELFAPTRGIAVQQSLFGPDEPEFCNVPRKGPKVHLLMSDDDFRHQFSHWFYTGSPEARQLRDADDFASLVRNVLNLVSAHSVRKFGQWVDGLSESLGYMLYELIDNTHKWGRHGAEGQLIKSMRGTVFDVKFDYPGNRTRVADIANDIPLIADFIRYHSNLPETRDLGLLEMSVFDGGIGIPARELNRRKQKNASIQQEYEATLGCLRKWGTTSGQPGRGLGLDRVLELTSQRRGFVYLRTGRLILYRDFANQPASTGNGDAPAASGFEIHAMHDGTTHSVEPTAQSLVSGTLFTVVLPFNAATA